MIFSFNTKKEGYTTTPGRPPSESVRSQKWFTTINGTGLDDNDVKEGKLVIPNEICRLLTKVHLHVQHLNKEFKLELN